MPPLMFTTTTLLPNKNLTQVEARRTAVNHIQSLRAAGTRYEGGLYELQGSQKKKYINKSLVVTF